MKPDRNEKLIIIALAAALAAGSFLLYLRNSRPPARIEVVDAALEPDTSLEEITSMLERARRVDVNTASREELVAVPGIGEKTYLRITAYREAHGNFETLDDLVYVEGIGKKKLKKIRPYLKIE